MAGTINANQDNTVTYNAKLPQNNVNDQVIVDFAGHYVPDFYTDSIGVDQIGSWIRGVIPQDMVPPRDDYYDVSIYATSDGDIHWAHEDRTWASIDETWAAVEGIVRGVLINNSSMKVEGNESYT